jgi:hypothetical protein
VWLGEAGESSPVGAATWSAADNGRGVAAEPTVTHRHSPAEPDTADPAARPSPPAQPCPAGQTHQSLPATGGTLVLPVLDAGEQVGVIEVTMPAGRTLRTFERDLLEDVAAQAGVAFRNAMLETELAARISQGKAQSAELGASRRRLVSVEDDARERLAGAIRRRVVPHLAAIDNRLSPDAAPPTAAGGSAQTALLQGDVAEPQTEPGGPDVQPLIAETERALDELRAVCRGVFPALLERRGLIPALSTQLDETHPLAALKVDDSACQRLNRATEAAGYSFCVEVAPPNRPSTIELRVADDLLIITVTGGRQWASDCGAPAVVPTAWQHARDRVAALDGNIDVRQSGAGLVVTAQIPLVPQPDRDLVMANQVSSSRSGPNIDLGR